MPQQNDELVRRAKTRADALGELYDLHYERVYGYCARRLACSAAAEDVTATVFLKIARKIQTFRGETLVAFRCWMYRIATNEINNHLRRRIRRRRTLEDALTTRAIDPNRTQEPAQLPDDYARLHKAMQQLTRREQSAVTLRYFEELPSDEIAVILECKAVTVRVTVSRALAKLRETMNHRQIETSRETSDVPR
ncbi:MAG: RNA polymerase sigma factor [Phycisphaerae bacterium]